jgi:hypothetical protein
MYAVACSLSFAVTLVERLQVAHRQAPQDTSGIHVVSGIRWALGLAN